MKIYGHPGTSAGRCYWLLEELGIKYEVGEVNMRNGDHKKPWFLDINPNGKIPALEDGDVKLGESMAINQYITEKHCPDFAGSTLEQRALIAQWNYWSITEYQKPIIDLLIQQAFVPEPKRDINLMEKSRTKINDYNRTLDNALSGRTYLAGPEFSLADLNVAFVANICSAIGVSLSDYSNTQGWLSRISERESSKTLAKISKH